jgi:hypothetical protein
MSTSTPKWTPGPWRARLVSCDDGMAICLGDGTQLAYMVNPEFSELTWDATVANARLIAAAPDMFNAVDAALIYLQRGDLTNLGQLADLMDILHSARSLAVYGRQECNSSPGPDRTAAGNDSAEISPALGSWRFSGDGDAEIALVSPCAATERFPGDGEAAANV